MNVLRMDSKASQIYYVECDHFVASWETGCSTLRETDRNRKWFFRTSLRFVAVHRSP